MTLVRPRRAFSRHTHKTHSVADRILEKTSKDYNQFCFHDRLNKIISQKRFLVQSKEIKAEIEYGKVACSNGSCLEANAVFFVWLMKGIFDHYVL